LPTGLAEAFAEKLHETVRKEIWGYAEGEAFDNEGLIKEAYAGIRPAPGYPACPDHTEKPATIQPAGCREAHRYHVHRGLGHVAYSCGERLLFRAPKSKYFGVGKVSADQIASLAERKGQESVWMERWLGSNLAY
jgi:5-methyltetrahydrofolate--homocysteine methyltransferase